jgi:hypothetical protein
MNLLHRLVAYWQEKRTQRDESTVRTIDVIAVNPADGTAIFFITIILSLTFLRIFRISHRQAFSDS